MYSDPSGVGTQNEFGDNSSVKRRTSKEINIANILLELKAHPNIQCLPVNSSVKRRTSEEINIANILIELKAHPTIQCLPEITTKSTRRSSSKSLRQFERKAHNSKTLCNTNKEDEEVLDGNIPDKDIILCDKEIETILVNQISTPQAIRMVVNCMKACFREFNELVDELLQLEKRSHISLDNTINLCINENQVKTKNRTPENKHRFPLTSNNIINIHNNCSSTDEDSMIEDTKRDLMIKNTKRDKRETPNAGTRRNIKNMVAIGTGRTMIPRPLYENINWDCYNAATRNLLQIIFSRDILATHSRTGRPSPAFQNKPAKKCLNKQAVDDIVITVVKKCKVKPNLVKKAITSKLADENKMWRMKQKKLKISQ